MEFACPAERNSLGLLLDTCADLDSPIADHSAEGSLAAAAEAEAVLDSDDEVSARRQANAFRRDGTAYLLVRDTQTQIKREDHLAYPSPSPSSLPPLTPDPALSPPPPPSSAAPLTATGRPLRRVSALRPSYTDQDADYTPTTLASKSCKTSKYIQKDRYSAPRPGKPKPKPSRLTLPPVPANFPFKLADHFCRSACSTDSARAVWSCVHCPDVQKQGERRLGVYTAHARRAGEGTFVCRARRHFYHKHWAKAEEWRPSVDRKSSNRDDAYDSVPVQLC